MSDKYISFDGFNEIDYEQFINDLPKKLLLKPIRNIENYKKNPRIKSFREESIDENFIRELYLKDYRSEKKLLQTHLLTIMDKVYIKKELSNKEYDILKKRTFTKEEFDNISLKLLENSAIKTKYIKKLLNVSDDLLYRFESDKKHRKKEEEIEKFKINEKVLMNKIEDFKATIEKYVLKDKMYQDIDKKNILLHEEIKRLENQISTYESTKQADNRHEKEVGNIECILKLVKESINREMYSVILNKYKNMDFKDASVNEILDTLYEVKKHLIEGKKFHEIKSIIFIEYIIINMREIIKNG